MTPGAKSSGEWDSIHVFEATDRARMSHYKLTSTVILHLANENETLGEMDLSGNMTRQVEVDLPVESDASHVANVGRLVEDMELKMRNLLRMFDIFLRLSYWPLSKLTYLSIEEVYFGKAKDVVGELRSEFSPLRHTMNNANRIPRPCTFVRDEQGQGCSPGDDQVDAEVASWRSVCLALDSVYCALFSFRHHRSLCLDLPRGFWRSRNALLLVNTCFTPEINVVSLDMYGHSIQSRLHGQMRFHLSKTKGYHKASSFLRRCRTSQ